MVLRPVNWCIRLLKMTSTVTLTWRPNTSAARADFERLPQGAFFSGASTSARRIVTCRLPATSPVSVSPSMDTTRPVMIYAAAVADQAGAMSNPNSSRLAQRNRMPASIIIKWRIAFALTGEDLPQLLDYRQHQQYAAEHGEIDKPRPGKECHDEAVHGQSQEDVPVIGEHSAFLQWQIDTASRVERLPQVTELVRLIRWRSWFRYYWKRENNMDFRRRS